MIRSTKQDDDKSDSDEVVVAEIRAVHMLESEAPPPRVALNGASFTCPRGVQQVTDLRPIWTANTHFRAYLWCKFALIGSQKGGWGWFPSVINWWRNALRIIPVPDVGCPHT